MVKTEVDYIVIGLGLAGIAFIENLIDNNKTFIAFEDNSQYSSRIAGGVYNPVILKRFTHVWNGHYQLAKAIPFYEKLENKFTSKYDYKIQIKRIFKSIEEQNNWFVASDKYPLQEYMIPEIMNSKVNGIESPFGYGKVKNTGRIDTNKLLDDYRNSIKEFCRFEKFEHHKFHHQESSVAYKDISAKKIIFCEGFGVKNNPYFNKLPLTGTKGELLTIKAPELKSEDIIKAPVFILPMGDDIYKVGATFNWDDKSNEPTLAGKNELVSKLNSFIKVPYTILNQTAGIRPTVKDRRPLVGIHKEFKNIAILNGLGTRGVMLAPTMAEMLFNHIEYNQPLDEEVTINRF